MIPLAEIKLVKQSETEPRRWTLQCCTIQVPSAFHAKTQKPTQWSVLTLLMPRPRNVMCVCLQPWPPFLPQTAGPWAPFFLTKTWRAPECSPGTLCLKDRHKSPAWAMGPNGRIRCAARPSLPLGSEMVRYCPPAVEKALSWGGLFGFFDTTRLQDQMPRSYWK